VVTLDSQVVGESHGELAEAELAMLDRALASHPTSPVLVVLHHGPHAVCAMEACQLRNPAVLLERLQRHAAPVVVVSGHNHCEADVVRKGIRSLVTPSTCIQLTHPISEKAAASGDFMAVHQLDCGRVGMRWLTLREDGACDSEVVWLPLSATGDTTT
jgi:Icc protein